MVQIEAARMDEIPQIRKLLKATWHDTYGHIFSPEDIEKITDTWQSPANLTRNIEDPDTYIAAAKEDGEMVGMATAMKTKEGDIFLVRLYIHPGHQKKGVGSQLLEAVIQHFPDAKKITLEVETDNPKGCAFYLKKRFKKVGEKEEIVEGVKLHSAVMEKNLP
jgi:ribosomal protein S18 acetylase RimI-like enzyme